MANTIIGKVHSINKAVNVSKTANPFMKRELVLDASRYDEYTGEKRENFPVIAFAQKNCEKLDAFRQGDLVEVFFILQGRSYEKDGQTKYITDVVGYKVEPKQMNGQAATQTPQVPAPPAQTPSAPAAEAATAEPLPF